MKNDRKRRRSITAFEERMLDTFIGSGEAVELSDDGQTALRWKPDWGPSRSLQALRDKWQGDYEDVLPACVTRRLRTGWHFVPPKPEPRPKPKAKAQRTPDRDLARIETLERQFKTMIDGIQALTTAIQSGSNIEIAERVRQLAKTWHVPLNGQHVQ